MANKELTQTDIKKIVKDEIKAYLTSQFEQEFKKMMSKTNSGGKKEVTKTVKDALDSLYQFMYIRRNVWQSEIK